MYFQGVQIRKNVPILPEAKGTEGLNLQSSQKKLRILFIGESTIAGVGVKTHQEGFAGTLANELETKLDVKIEWKVYAKSGYTAKNVTRKIIPKIKENEVDVIIIGLGGNDTFTLNTPWKWKNDIRDLIKTLQSRFKNVSIIFTNMPPIKEFPAFTKLTKFVLGNLVEILGEELEGVVSNFENVFYYSQTITIENWIKKMNIDAKPQDFFSDGVHPSKLTYQTWAKDFSNFILHDIAIKGNLEQRIKI
ncbi:SGNH/GDSL hydrolase family protein [Aquimarina gracilis]